MAITMAATPDEPDLIIVRNYSDARRIGEALRDRGRVLIDLRSADEEADARRIIDFCAGATFALQASMEKITNGVFFISRDSSGSPELRRRFTD